MKAGLAQLLGRPVTSVAGIAGGRNSKVYRVSCADGSQFAAKVYFRHSADPRDRLGVEFTSLQFLWETGLRSIPQAVAVDRDRGYGVYEFIEGEKPSSGAVAESDIDYAVDFLAQLNQLAHRRDCTHIPPASDACFSVHTIVRKIEARLSKLNEVESSEPQHLALHGFLTGEFVPSFSTIQSWCRSRSDARGIPLDAVLEDECRTLSPSDFGFHNAIRRGDGRIAFLDFEYFGWDDPAKMISDFVLHPGMDLGFNLKRRFVSGLLGRFQDPEKLASRIETVYPLFGLIWCLIILNEFVPEYLARRGFSSVVDLNRPALQESQLAKSRQLLNKINENYERFPYYE